MQQYRGPLIHTPERMARDRKFVYTSGEPVGPFNVYTKSLVTLSLHTDPRPTRAPHLLPIITKCDTVPEDESAFDARIHNVFKLEAGVLQFFKLFARFCLCHISMRVGRRLLLHRLARDQAIIIIIIDGYHFA